MNVIFESGYVPLCPNCGEMNLHHTKIDVFELAKEDDKTGNKTTVVGMKTDVNYCKLHGNPSSRRNGILIHFFCENCNVKPTLSIAQHKGQTLIEWI